MAFNETAYNETSICGDEVRAWEELEYWVEIGGTREGKVLVDSVSIEQDAAGIMRARCTVVDPDTVIAEGKTFTVVYRGEWVFAGIIRTMTIDADQAESALFYKVEADGWDSLLARHTVTKTYNDKTAGFILRDAIVTAGLNLDGMTAGVIDEGVTLILCESDHVRASEFIGDVAEAGGGVAYIDPYKRMQFRPATLDMSDIAITNARCERIQHIGDIDNYRNRQVVRVTGEDGTTTVTETRNDLVQQNLRIVDEGGSGIYEAFEDVRHPTSSVSGELSILGQTVGFVLLRTYARNARRVVVTMRDPAPRLGQLCTVNLPGFTLSGTFVVMRKAWREVGMAWVYDLEFWESSFQKQALESLLRIVGAGKASVSISANVFPNVQLFSTVGAATWTVPGGVTAAQFTCYGASGGGGGGIAQWLWAGTCVLTNRRDGGTGGASGKAVTILAVVPAQVYDVVVGGKGTKGTNRVDATGSASGCGSNNAGAAGVTGNLSNVSISAVVKCQGNAGGGGGLATPSADGTNGTAGGGIGDAVSVGGGIIGGPRGIGNGAQPGDGGDGYVEIRW